LTVLSLSSKPTHPAAPFLGAHIQIPAHKREPGGGP